MAKKQPYEPKPEDFLGPDSPKKVTKKTSSHVVVTTRGAWAKGPTLEHCLARLPGYIATVAARVYAVHFPEGVYYDANSDGPADDLYVGPDGVLRVPTKSVVIEVNASPVQFRKVSNPKKSKA